MAKNRFAAGQVHQRIAAAAVAAVLATSSVYAADAVYIGPAGGTWDADANWRNAGVDTIYNNGDDFNAQPGTADAAVILDGSTVNLNSAETILELQVSVPQHTGDTSATHGTARLNIGTGATLTTNGNSSGIRVGRVLDVGQAVGSSRGEIVQTGGTVVIQQGANGLRLSQADSGNVGDSYYSISGGSLRGGSGADGTMVSDLRLGAITNVWDEAEFHVIGSGATSIRFLDIQLGANAAENGDTIMHFSIDSGGVTTVVAEDELQFRGDATNGTGNNFLEIDMTGMAPESNLTLILADRLNTNGVTNSPSLERFTGMPDGTTIVRQFGGFEYTWTLRYTDPTTSADNGILDASVVLEFVSKVELIPEPGSATLLGLGALALAARRRR